MKTWINTGGEFRWNGSEYTEVSNTGYWHDGDIALCKKDSQAPDYAPMAEATKEATRVMAEHSANMLAETQRQYDDFAPVAKEVANTQLDVMRQNAEQGKDYYDNYKQNFRPIETSLVADVNNYNEDAESGKFASQAGADVEKQSAIQRQINARSMASRGVNPNSGAAIALDKQTGLQTAAIKAGAMTNATNKAKEIGYAKKLDAIGVGRNIPGMAKSAYDTATGSGNAATGNASAPGNFMLNGMNSAASIAGQGVNAGIQGNSAILNSKTSVANTNANNRFDVMDVVGTGIGAYAAFNS